MSKDIYWFQHDANASSDRKLKVLRRKYGWAGMGWWWFIIESFREEMDYQLPYSDFMFESLSEEFYITPDEVKQYIDDCIEKFGDKKTGKFLLALNGDYFYSPRFRKDMNHMEDVRETKRQAGLTSAEKRYGKSYREEGEGEKEQVLIQGQSIEKVRRMLKGGFEGKGVLPKNMEILRREFERLGYSIDDEGVK